MVEYISIFYPKLGVEALVESLFSNYKGMDKGANKIKGAIFACLGDCIVWNVVIFCYVNNFENLPQNMSCFRIF